MTKLLVANSYYGDGTTVEIINLDDSNPDLVCDNLSDHPIKSLSSATGQLYQETTPVICGGGDGSTRCDCYSYDNEAWNSFPSLNECKSGSASVIIYNPNIDIDEIFMITGVSNGQSTIESFNGSTWNTGRFAQMPTAVSFHCMVKINDSLLMSIGGTVNGQGATDDTFFFIIAEDKWKEGPKLNIARDNHACGIMNWMNTTSGELEKIVVVTAGLGTSSVELLNLNEYESFDKGWVNGPEAPFDRGGSTMNELENSVVLVGGHNLYQLSSPSGPWVEMNQTLKDERWGHVSFLVPDELVNCL